MEVIMCGLVEWAHHLAGAMALVAFFIALAVGILAGFKYFITSTDDWLP